MVANMMMTLAQWLTPRAQTAWFAAMQGEYAALTRGRSGWALGCLGAAAGWRLKADGVWLVTCLAFPFLLEPLSRFWWEINLPSPEGTMGYVLSQVPKASLWCVIGMVWPRRLWATALLSVLTYMTYTYSVFWIRFDMPFTGYVNHMDLPPIVGEGAVLALALLSVWAGRALRRAVRKPHSA